MPLSEFLRLAIEKLESSKQKACSADASSRNENNLVEVVWENGPVHHSLSPNTPNVHDAALGISTTPNLDVDIAVEPIVASSVGRGNIVDGFSYEQTPKLKRKLCDIESESHIDEIQTEPIGVEKPTPARGGTEVKRNRSAEVHNLSERRRRDRINEKLRALQELIPNCNKSDKASMLDEAVQYLKNLQHQVQIMSMGGGFYIQPMMYPMGSQHMYPAPIPHFLPSSVGMGTSMSFGNMTTAGSRLHPIFHGVHFLSGDMSFQATELPMNGHVCPGFHATVPRPPMIPLTGSNPNALRLSSSIDQMTNKE